jgi:hypothetical protein
MMQEEWLRCLERLLDDMTEEDGRIKLRSGECDTRSEGGAAQVSSADGADHAKPEQR